MNRRIVTELLGKSSIIEQDEIVEAIASAPWERDFTDPEAWGESRMGYLCSADSLPSGSLSKSRTAEEKAADEMWIHELKAMAQVLEIGLDIQIADNAVWVTQERVIQETEYDYAYGFDF